MTTHFIDIADFDGDVLKQMLADAVAMKSGGKKHHDLLAGQTVAMILKNHPHEPACLSKLVSAN